jgi:hypothetical protein
LIREEGIALQGIPDLCHNTASCLDSHCVALPIARMTSYILATFARISGTAASIMLFTTS